MTRWLDKEQAAVDTGILDVTLTLSSEFLAEVGRVLILDILDNGVPAGLVVSLHSYFCFVHKGGRISYHRSLLTWSP
jgi:hypothetical protein